MHVEAKSGKFRQLVVIGAGGQAANVLNVASSVGYSIYAFIHESRAGEKRFQIPILPNVDEVGAVDEYDFCLAIGDNYDRQQAALEVQERFPGLRFPSLVHPSVDLAPHVEIGEGAVIMPHSVIGTNATIGAFCIVGNQSTVGHDCVIADFASLGPASALAGNVSLGLGSAVGLGARVRERSTIGSNAVLGSNSFLNGDLGDDEVAFGTPARVQKKRLPGDPYLR
jgi:sugar O-acyltransferase (sialic acid O-acetyltransferase NeuD family)